MTTFALGIPHTPWILDRAESLDRLKFLLGTIPRWYREFSDKEPNWSWSGKLWHWACETGATHLVQLQDDAIVGPDFWPHLRAMVDAVPDQIIGLESVHPASQMLYDQGYDWYTTLDGLIGVGYVVPAAVLTDFLRWRSTMLRPRALESINEDTLLGLFALSTKRRIYHPLPTIIDHDVDLASTYGNDAHPHRRPLLTTVRGADARGWARLEAPCLGRFYDGTPRDCRRWVKSFHLDEMDRLRGGT